MTETSPQALTLLIRHRERELQEINELRCSQLEAIIAERDELLIESSRRFELLKEDFRYNLGLIEARDVELERLDNSLKVTNTNYEKCDNERRTLAIRLEATERNLIEMEQKSDSEKAKLKAIMDEIREVLQDSQWTHQEDLRTKNREIEVCKEELNRMNTMRQESLDVQRRDLSESFERVLAQRDQVHSAKEAEMNKQNNDLNIRLEKYHTENARLNAELVAAQRQHDATRRDLEEKEEVRRQLQWQLDDERSSKTHLDDVLQRQVQHAQLELTLYKDQSAKEADELKKQIEKLKSDLTREEDFRAALQKRLADQVDVYAHDRHTLEAEVREYRGLENLLQNEAATLREERDSVLNRAASVRLELESTEVKLKTMHRENDLLRGELSAERARVNEQEMKLLSLSQELQRSREEVRERESKSLQFASDQILDNKNSTYEELTRLKEQHRTEMENLRQIHKHELKQCADELAAKSSEYQAQLSSKANECVHMMQSLVEAQNEAKAVQLRLDARETELYNVRNTTADRYSTHQQRLRVKESGDEDDDTLSQEMESVSMDFNSPMRAIGGGKQWAFSATEVPSPSPRRPSGPSSKPLTAQSMQALQQKLDQSMESERQWAARTDELITLNSKLKEEVKKMRSAMDESVNQQKALLDDNEALRTELEQTGSQTERLKVMEVHVGQLQDEVSRLRRERQRLMDVGNELRGTNHKLERRLQEAGLSLRDDASFSLFDFASTSASPSRATHLAYTAPSPAYSPGRVNSLPPPPGPSTVYVSKTATRHDPFVVPLSSASPIAYQQQQAQSASPGRERRFTVAVGNTQPSKPQERSDMSQKAEVPRASVRQQQSELSPDRPQTKPTVTSLGSPVGQLFERMSAVDAVAEEQRADRSNVASELSLSGKTVASVVHPTTTSVNRGVSVFHNRHPAPVPISNSDRTTVSQMQALAGLKSRRASTGSAPLTGKAPTARNWKYTGDNPAELSEQENMIAGAQ